MVASSRATPRVYVVGDGRSDPTLRGPSRFFTRLSPAADRQGATACYELRHRDLAPRAMSLQIGAEGGVSPDPHGQRLPELSVPPLEEALYCIRRGACLNVCPVYRPDWQTPTVSLHPAHRRRHNSCPAGHRGGGDSPARLQLPVAPAGRYSCRHSLHDLLKPAPAGRKLGWDLGQETGAAFKVWRNTDKSPASYIISPPERPVVLSRSPSSPVACDSYSVP